MQPTLELDPKAFPGGIAVWGAMPPVLDTTGMPPEQGVHVHARVTPGKRKAIDDTFEAVHIQLQSGLSVQLDSVRALAFNIAEILQIPVAALACPACGRLHTDTGEAAVCPHHEHQCEFCGFEFFAQTSVVSNSICAIRQQLQSSFASVVQESKYQWERTQAQYPGGIQIWGSNNAIVWTAERPEESGIHVHGYSDAQATRRSTDETFGLVMLDGEQLDPMQIRYLMAQSASATLASTVKSIHCLHCGTAHFSRSRPYAPTKVHVCLQCGRVFQTDVPVLANPMKAICEKLQNSARAFANFS